MNIINQVLIELFSGTKSISKVFESNGWQTFTIDNNAELEPDLCIDILDFNVSMLPEQFKNPGVVWASPPCTHFSVCTIAKHWKNGKPNSSKCFNSLALAFKAKELIKELKPNFYFIENPRGMLRKQFFMFDMPRKLVTYCQYGKNYQKPTDIWTNCNNFIPKKCNRRDNCHEYQSRTYKRKIAFFQQGLGTQGLSGAKERGEIPGELCKAIYDAVNMPGKIQAELT